MSGEGLSVSFRRTSKTIKSSKQLLKEFQDLVYSNKKVMSHMKWYGQAHTVELIEHGNKELPYWQQEAVAIKDTFQFAISVYESWGENSNYYECHKTEGSFVSIARKFANENALMYFPDGFPAEWIEQEIINGEKHWNHFIVKPDDKNIDKICEVWHSYGLAKIKEDSKELWYKARNMIKQLMENKNEYYI